MENGLPYRKHQETKMGQSSNQLVVLKGLQQQVILSEAEHQYILTLVDYTTRYPEAVPLKKITTEAVAEVILDIYRRVGIL